MGTISQTTSAFYMNEKFFLFWLEFHFISGSDSQKLSIGSDDGLVSSWQQTITWTNSDPIHISKNAPFLVIGYLLIEAKWCIYVSENSVITDRYNGLLSIRCHFFSNRYQLAVNRTHRSNEYWKIRWKVLLENIHLKCLLRNSGQ